MTKFSKSNILAADIIAIGAAVLGVNGFLFGIWLGIFSKRFKVETDPREEKILNALPGANCGACGYPSCEQFAHAILFEGASPATCRTGGTETARKVGEILGQKITEVVKKVAVVMCKGCENCSDEFVYVGINECRYANMLFEGQKSCKYGCLGFGDCSKACPFGAIEFKPGTIPKIDIEKCKGCGLCVDACPKGVIELVPSTFKFHVRCKSLDDPRSVREYCKYGCIGCQRCVKSCPESDIKLFDKFLVKMEYQKCNNCGKCVEVCPRECIGQL